jgi:ribosomal protein S18 acetylase RimI-like enzyme
MPLDVLIRSATRDDLSQLTELSVGIQRLHARGRPDLFQKPDPSALRTFLQPRVDDESVLLVAELEGNVVGYLLAEAVIRAASPFRCASSSLYIHHIAVAPVSQRNGVGAQLLRQAVSIAREQDASMVRLDSWAFNGDAHEFFKAEGFTPVNIVFEQLLN